jgi:hypothetical protein
MVKAIRASVLIILLACSAQAGDMPNGTPTPPPQPAQTTEEESTAQGDTPSDAADTLIEAALSVLNNVLALL